MLHCQFARLRRSGRSDCSLLTVSDRPTGRFQSLLRIAQVGGGVAVVVRENLSAGSVKFIKYGVTCHRHYPQGIRAAYKSACRKAPVRRAIGRCEEARGRSRCVCSFASAGIVRPPGLPWRRGARQSVRMLASSINVRFRQPPRRRQGSRAGSAMLHKGRIRTRRFACSTTTRAPADSSVSYCLSAASTIEPMCSGNTRCPRT